MRDVLDRPTPPGTRSTRVAPGTVLRGRYEVGPLLGRGGMAEVYVAHDRILDRSVAVKVLRGPLASDPVAEAGFVREARAAASLAHPNIVAVHDAGTEGQISFLVMELVRGQPLSELLARTGRLEPERAAAIVAAMADALASAHDHGVVHRDVKPSNVLITDAGWVKVVDFGIASARSAGAPNGHEGLGTAGYASPEQARGDEVDGRSDVYSLGVVLFEMLTGRLPGPDPAKALDLLPPTVPIGVRSVLERCLQPDPSRRYQTARQVARDLALIRPDARGMTVPVHGPVPTAQLPSGPKPSRRRLRTVVVALVTGVALVGATLAVAAFIGRPPPPKHRATTRPPAPLLSPAGIHVASACDGFLAARAVIRWQPSANHAVDGYAIYRSQSADGPWRKVELVGSRGVGSFVDHGLDTSTGYFYVIQATSGSHMSDFSSPVQVRTPSFCLF